ncbi:MAG: hypothetical protein ABIB71_01205 [Candidatus Woesearchaeota archaeon]
MGTLLAVKKFAKTPVTNQKYLVVVYREMECDGFVLTAYFSNKPRRRAIIWQKH